MKNLFTLLLTVVACALSAQITTTVWNPAANPDSDGLWSDADNWTTDVAPDGAFKVVFNVPDARDAILNDTRSVNQFVLGDNGPGETLVIADGGALTTSMDVWSASGYNDTARLVVETGGVINFGLHMWVGHVPGGHGTVELNGGTINVGAMTGLGWEGGKGFVYVNDGTLNMTGFDPNQSIGDGSLLEIGDGTVNIPGNQVGGVEAYVAAGKITARGGGMLSITYDDTADRTIITAAATPQETTVWDPAGNPASTGLWSEAANWSDGFVPDGNKVVFNVPDAANAVLDYMADTVGQFVLGDNGPGGTLVVADGGTLTASMDIWSAVGYNDTARLVVETGGEVNFGQHMWVGLEATGYGTVEINGGTINVGAMTGLGWNGGKGFVYVNDGTLNMTGFDPNLSIGEGSLLEIGDGTVTIPGNQVGGVEAYVTAGRIGARGEAMLSVTYDESADKTIITAAATRQATTVWDPAGNAASTGLWSEAANWSDGFVPDGNKVVLNVPGAADAVVNSAVASINQFVLGDNGPGGNLIIADGGSLTTSADIWSAVGYNDTARLVVETGGEISFGQHMWIGFTPEGYGIVDINGGTINVGAMTGIGWDGGAGIISVNSGELNMTGFDPNKSIGDGSSIDIEDGTVYIPGDQVGNVNALVTAGKITAFDGTGTVMVALDETTNRTVITADATNSVGTVAIPGKIELKQNYPNPFAEATTIGFVLRESARIKLGIYNAAGQQVANLVNRELPVGSHEVVWEAGQLPVGVYVVKLVANSRVLARQITLTR